MMDIILNTGSTVYQGAIIKGGNKFTEGYVREAAYCNINPEDFEALGRPWYVRVTNEYGDSVVVKAKKTGTQQKGEVFIPRGIWANTVVTPETESTGSPRYKNLPVKIEKCEGPVLGPEALMRANFTKNGKGQEYEAKKYLDKTTSQVSHS
ncbi:MAG TPA: molybdopterin dinucleotide binding domain-containing protein [Methanocella sp.]|uniref:molybdopterin dinucleotide binding domain-containing protein n=1 Tax=Methanocella sp. TaxID=2052833 RepID=UPI002C3899AD|nr:molybdopterin dinucleotide binding domain-containing protein [Methanocella sp.]HTY90449.1 molybdopterin dinucleotide binding domain-containing protein [Methanocella sp.]